MGWSEDAARNRDLWTKTNAEYTDGQAARKWALDEFSWGIWGVAEADVGVIGETVEEQRLAVVDIASGSIRSVTPSDVYVYEYDWSPDGKRFAVT